MPAQVLDGPGVHFGLGWRMTLSDHVSFGVELAADRTTITGLSVPVPSPHGGIAVQVDEQLWAFPGLLGVALGGTVGEQMYLGIDVAGGAIYQRIHSEQKVVDGPTLSDESEGRWAALVRGRVDVEWRMDAHAMLLGTAWQQVLGDEERKMTASGLIVEAGWRAYFGD